MGIRQALMDRAFCLPRGVLGQVGGRLLALDRVLPAWVLDLLEVQASEAVLEIATGPGVGIELSAARANSGRVAGVDPSPAMLKMACRRNRMSIAAGLVELRQATADALPFQDAAFDVAFTVNSVHLWKDPAAALYEIKRTLRPGGRIGLAVSRFSHVSPDRFEHLLGETAFKMLKSHVGDMGACVTGRVS